MIGLDLGSKYMKGCTVATRSDGSYIVYAAMSSYGIREKKDNPVELKNKVKHIIRQLRIKNKEVTLSVGGIDLLARDFLLPKMNEANLHGAVMMEAENSIFETLDDMYSDFQVLSDPSDDKMDILFVASPKRHINQMMESLALTDLDITGVGADNVALANAFIAFDERKAALESVVVVNIGHEVSNIAIIDRGKLRFIRNVAFGGKDVTAEIASMYEVDVETAEQLKRQHGVWDKIGLNIKNVLKKSSSNLLEAVFRSMEYCVSRQKIGKVDRILLTGGGAIVKGIDNFIWETLGINTEKWNPLESDSIKGVVNSELGLFVPVALGLALQKGAGNV